MRLFQTLLKVTISLPSLQMRLFELHIIFMNSLTYYYSRKYSFVLRQTPQSPRLLNLCFIVFGYMKASFINSLLRGILSLVLRLSVGSRGYWFDICGAYFTKITINCIPYKILLSDLLPYDAFFGEGFCVNISNYKLNHTHKECINHINLYTMFNLSKKAATAKILGKYYRKPRCQMSFLS